MQCCVIIHKVNIFLFPHTLIYRAIMQIIKEQVFNNAGNRVNVIKYLSQFLTHPSSTTLLSANTWVGSYVEFLESRKKRSHVAFLSKDLSLNDHSTVRTIARTCVCTWTRDAQKWRLNSGINEDWCEIQDRANVNVQKQVPMTSAKLIVLFLMHNLRKTKGKVMSSCKKRKRNYIHRA